MIKIGIILNIVLSIIIAIAVGLLNKEWNVLSVAIMSVLGWTYSLMKELQK